MLITQHKSKTYLIFFLLSAFSISLSAQQKIPSDKYLKTFTAFSKALKETKVAYVFDTTQTNLGPYDVFAKKYFDVPAMRANFVDDTSVYNLAAKFFLLRKFIATLQDGLKSYPDTNLVIKPIDEYYGPSKIAERDKDKYDLMTEHSLMVIYKDAKKEIPIFLVTFAPKSKKIIFITGMGLTVETAKYLDDLKSSMD